VDNLRDAPVKLNLRIHEIVFDGLPLHPATAPQLQESLVRSLTERLAVDCIDLASAPTHSGEFIYRDGLDPGELGREVAHCLYPLADPNRT
jgi:hypothetical protein